MMTIESKLKSLTHRELVVFDFDETIVDCNSDSWIHELAPGRKLPEHLEYMHGQDYFKHVQSVLAHLHENNVREKDYSECLSKMPAVTGMIDPLIKALAEKRDEFDMIILSDSNSFFISSYLKSKSLENCITTVLTNPARFTDEGQLIIDEYHVQDYCNLSSRNLCKGEALKNFIGKRMLDCNTVYTCINYIGDGENDLCPCTKLSARDRVFPRDGYSLARLCSKWKANQLIMRGSDGSGTKISELNAAVIPWTTGDEILDVIAGRTTV